jgi:uncharacterized protein YbjT (DUF2867 family)
MTELVPKRVLVLGGYGLIGANVARALSERGHEVIALGRDLGAARRVLPGFPWVIRDMRALTKPDDWLPLVQDVDFVVNCAGALQDNLRDNLEVVHLHAIGALVLACEKTNTSIVQISAVGANPHSVLPFYRTKAEGDALIRESHVDWWIFRPGLVIAPSSYCGTTMIRMMAGVPLVQPIALPHAPVQSVSVRDVAKAVTRAVEGKTPSHSEADLVEDKTRALVEVVAMTRRWLGFPAAGFTWTLPGWTVRAVGRIADLFGVFGWRSPMRTTAVKALELGVLGDAKQTRQALGRPACALEDTFHDMQARVEDRHFARIQLLAPFLILSISVAWILQGLSGLFGINELVQDMSGRGIPVLLSRSVVAFLGIVGVVLGISLLFRKLALRTLLVMVFVTIFYGVAVTLLAPWAWTDPFGSGADILPITVSLLIARVLMDTR